MLGAIDTESRSIDMMTDVETGNEMDLGITGKKNWKTSGRNTGRQGYMFREGLCYAMTAIKSCIVWAGGERARGV